MSGTVKIHLEEFLIKKGICKNKLCYRAEMNRTQLNKYCNNEIKLVDIKVLARICTVLECSVSDLIEFIPDDSISSK